MKDCIFCEIANGDESKLVWQNDVAAAFKSIAPEAKIHVLVVPKQHVKNIDALANPNALEHFRNLDELAS